MISLKTFQALTAALRCSVGDGRDIPNERRAHPRLHCQAEATIVFVGKLGPKPYSLRIHDMSFGGIAIYFSQALTIGARFILLAQEVGSRKRHAVLCSVTHSRRAGTDASANEYVIAATFVREMESAQTDEDKPAAHDDREEIPKPAPAAGDDLFNAATFEPPGGRRE